MPEKVIEFLFLIKLGLKPKEVREMEADEVNGLMSMLSVYETIENSNLDRGKK